MSKHRRENKVGNLFLVDGMPLLAAMFFVALGVLAHVLENINDWAETKDMKKRLEIGKCFIFAFIMAFFVFDLGILGVDYGSVGFGVSYGAIGYGAGQGLAALFNMAQKKITG